MKISEIKFSPFQRVGCGVRNKLCPVCGSRFYYRRGDIEWCSKCEEVLNLTKEVPMSFQERLAKCLDRYDYGGLLLYTVPQGLELWKVHNGQQTDCIVNTSPSAAFSRGDQLEEMLFKFERWLDDKEKQPRIFTDESGKKYRVTEVEE